MIHAERLAYEIIRYKKQATELQIEYEELKLKAAWYKAQAFRKWDLTDKIWKQIEVNFHYSNGEFNGFCYYYAPDARYLDLCDMYKEGILNKQEYEFCASI